MDLSSLNKSLAGRRKFVDETAETIESLGISLSELRDSASNRFVGYNFKQGKSSTGFNGLVNQGATCYLNSLVLTFTK